MFRSKEQDQIVEELIEKHNEALKKIQTQANDEIKNLDVAMENRM